MLPIEEIFNFMKEQFDWKHFFVQEHFKFWSDMQRKPGQTLQELSDAATCDFPLIIDPQDEALRQIHVLSTMKLSWRLFSRLKTQSWTLPMLSRSLLRPNMWRGLLRKLFTDPRPVLSRRSSRGRTRVNQKTTSSLISQNPNISVTDVKRLIKTAPTKKSDIWKLFSQTSMKKITKAELVKMILVMILLGWLCQSQCRTDSSQWNCNDGKVHFFASLETTRKTKLDDVRYRCKSPSKHKLPVLWTFMGQTK